MCLPGREKLGSVVADLLAPQRVDDTYPEVRQRAQRDTVTFALTPLTSVIGQRPVLLRRGLPGELVQGVAQGLDARQTLTRPRKLAALVGDGGGPRQCLHTRCTPEA